ncbi:lysine transporter LysE [Sporosarcina sp. P18a]|nr:lysine transporter LysE [Sporosarcina sp. P18a]
MILAVFGLSTIVLQFEWLRFSLVLVGVLFLLYMGHSIWNTKPKANESNNALPIRQQIMFALSVSLLNPHAILDTVGVIGTSALKYVEKEQVYFTIGCIIVAWGWFFGLMIAGSVLKKLDTTGNLMNILNKCLALFIWGIAIYLLIIE